MPVTWDETRILQGDIGEYIVSARRKGKDWYIGAMTNEAGRTLKVPLDFLGDGSYTTTIWQDGKTPSSVKRHLVEKTGKHTLKLSLAPSGGAVVQLIKR
ncbi:glycoside hydrolase family 97 C-terminal domain-containing protein [Cellvibrio sp. ARAG 10.3]|uniref:glycoside hydrolase family 97 C-terminal domain-containing protein n=1 Tax=Cellvibrio sp. ARAG 10.3 TaxID=3451358 RepID=UPI003F44E27A